MTDISEKIKSQGYWRIRIRPSEYSRDRIANITDILPLLHRLSVRISGWDFPPVDLNIQPLIHGSYVAQEIEWEHFIDSWRFYQSGQFVFLGGFCVDWPSRYFNAFPRAEVLLIEHTVAKYVEVLEFAARLSASPAGSDNTCIEIGAHGLEGRQLASTSPVTSMFLQARTATAHFQEFVHQEEIPQEQLLAEAEANSSPVGSRAF